MSDDLNSLEGIKAWLTNQLAGRLELDARDIDIGERFSRYGLKSAVATSMVSDLSKALGRPLVPTLVWDHPTIEKLSNHLMAAGAPAATAGDAPAADSSASSGPAARSASSNEPIAIIGMSCRFPNSPNLEKYWELLKNGVDAIREVPADRWSLDEYFSEDTTIPGKMSTRWGGFLDQVDKFDPGFFAISPREAIQMDPNQRLVMELCWEALEDAGIDIGSLVDSMTGVYMGNIWNDYGTLAHRGNTDYVQQHTSTGSHYSIIANRVSYFMGLQGPSMTIDTACSSSLVAVHLACQALRNGEATMAMAGGVNLIIAPDSTVNMSKFGAMAPDGRSKAFDHRANGYVRGEGAGVIVLKPLSAALADGDPIYATVPGSAVNNDGPSNGLTAPNPASQQNVLKLAYERAGVKHDRVHYVETHGTGTMLGDPLEAGALGAVLGAGRDPKKPLMIGSVKTNFGHLEGAAGIAGLIKLVLAIQNRAVPPSLHFQKPNPNIPFKDINVEVNHTFRPWPYDEPVVAGVSSFGFGGTNAHVVIEEFARSSAQLLAISAKTPEGLKDVAQQLRDELKEEKGDPLAEIGFAAARSLTSHSNRLAIAAGSQAEMTAQLSAFLKDRAKPGLSVGQAPGEKPPVVFFCPGQGGQWLGMGRELMRTEPVFRAALEQCDEAIRGVVEWSLLDELMADEASSRISNPEVDIIQPAIWAMQVAQAALWKSWGIEPDIVIGHSMGEVAAAYIAGMLSLEDTARIICIRSILAKKASGKGGMMVVNLPAEDCEKLIEPTGGKVSVASCNSPTSTVLSGDPEQLNKILADLESQEIFARLVKVDFASHSHQMDPLLDDLFNALREIKPQGGSCKLVSTVTADYIKGSELNPSYWVRNLRNTVQFAQAVELVLRDGCETFLEMSPHPVLAAPVEETMKFHKLPGKILASTRRDEDERAVMLENLGQLYTLGCNVDWGRLYSSARGEYELGEKTLAAGEATSAAALEPERTNGDLFLLSGRTQEAVGDFARSMADYIKSHEGVSLKDLSYTTTLKRNHHDFRLAVVAQTREELIASLEDTVAGEENNNAIPGRIDPKRNRKMAFIYTGQGAQWFAMGRELMAPRGEPVFRNKLREIDDIFQQYAPWSIIDELSKPESESRIMETEVAQPCIFAVQVALTELWKHWSIEPSAVLGHSVGEVAAAHVAGLLSLKDATMLIYHRGRFMQEATGLGKMIHVAMTAEKAAPYIAGLEDKVAIAAYNSPSAVVLSGETAALEGVVAKLKEANVFHKMLPVDYAFHSPQMEPFKHKLAKAVASITPLESDGKRTMFSSVKAAPVASWEVEAAYWGDNIRGAVRFEQAVQALIDAGYANFLEVGSHPALANYLNECLEKADRPGTVVHSLQRNKPERMSMLRSLSKLYTRGFPVDWRRMHRQGGRFVKLPAYPWQRQRWWNEKLDEMKPESLSDAVPIAPASATGAIPAAAPAAGPARPVNEHPYLGQRMRSSLARDKGTVVFEALWDARDPYMFRDHVLFDMVVVPGAGHVSLILLAAREALGTDSLVIRDAEFMQALVLPEGEPRYVQLSLIPDDDGEYKVQMASQAADGSEDDWMVHAAGRVAVHADEVGAGLSEDKIDELMQNAATEFDRVGYYDAMRECGYHWGETFKWIENLWRGEGEVLAIMKKPEAVHDFDNYVTFPGFHDALYQATTAAFPGGVEKYADSDTIYVPWGTGEAKVHGKFQEDMLVHVLCHDKADAVSDKQEVFKGDLFAYDSEGNLVYELKGWVLKRVSSSALLRSIQKKLAPWTYSAEWREAKAAPPIKTPGRWMLLADGGGAADALAGVLKSQDQEVFFVRPGKAFAKTDDGYTVGSRSVDDFKQVFAAETPRGVVDLWSLDAEENDTIQNDSISALDLETEVLDGLEEALSILPGLASSSTPPRLFMVTREAVAAGDSKQFRLSRASRWGLGRVAAVELPDVNVTMIDLGDAKDQAGQIDSLAAEVLAGDGELEVALRGNKRYISRLKRIPPGDNADLPLDEKGAYLITGGLGGLGLRIGKWLAEHGAKHLVLTGRSEPNEEAQKAIKELEEQGVTVQIARGDVSEAADVQRIMGEIKPALKGLIHAAGVLDDGTILTMNRERMQKVLRAKVGGAWNLHQATAGMSLDFFLLYSSVAGLLGSPGQANYASGNTFLDALAHWRRSRGLTAQSINWGPWKEVGMAAELDARRSNRGYPKVGMIDVNRGMDLMGALLKQDLTQAAVLAFDWVKYTEEFPTAAALPMLRDLTGVQRSSSNGSTPAASGAGATAAADPAGAAAAPAAKGPGILDDLNGTAPGERAKKLQGFVIGHVIKVLGLPAGSSVDIQKGLFEMGLDSLMAVELKNRLQKESGQSLPATLTFDYPDVEKISGFLLNDVFELSTVDTGPAADEGAPASGAPKPAMSAAELDAPDDDAARQAELEALSDEDAEAELLRQLEMAESD